ncbi:hypothetical protein BB560_000096 [Smittium megazygosporum]|uniref:Yeast cell wall synthesis Kre9/Knh1-like N-terminal domain-containing protein n=1 Tax=Smittium megazygosporum TaxID=133381 RepID=A0A2T9ZL83_9FUNG|nr:hypothetical protein BB560_000096 [Smittium megazygosporum]
MIMSYIDAQLEIKEPNVSSVWSVGSEETISWRTKFGPDQVLTISLLEGETQSEMKLVSQITDSVRASDLKYLYKVEMDLEPGSNYEVKIESNGNEFYSKKFKIQGQNLTSGSNLTTKNAGSSKTNQTRIDDTGSNKDDLIKSKGTSNLLEKEPDSNRIHSNILESSFERTTNKDGSKIPTTNDKISSPIVSASCSIKRHFGNAIIPSALLMILFYFVIFLN